MMRATSLYQPYASLAFTDFKLHETRPKLTHIRGPVIIQAAQKIATNLSPQLRAIVEMTFGGDWEKKLPRMSLLGIVEITDCLETTAAYCKTTISDRVCGNWDDGRWAWRLDNKRLFKKPIPYSGSQGWFKIPDTILINNGESP